MPHIHEKLFGKRRKIFHAQLNILILVGIAAWIAYIVHVYATWQATCHVENWCGISLWWSSSVLMYVCININNVCYYNHFGKKVRWRNCTDSPLSILSMVSTMCGLFRVMICISHKWWKTKMKNNCAHTAILLNNDSWDCSASYIWQHDGSRDLKIERRFVFHMNIVPMRLACCWSFIQLVLKHWDKKRTMVCWVARNRRENLKIYWKKVGAVGMISESRESSSQFGDS